MQTIKNKITSLVLASVMLLTLIAGILPRTPIYAADGGTGGLQISSPKDGGEVNGYETIRVSWNKYTGVDHYILIVKDQNTNKEVFRDEDVGSSTKTYRIYSDDDVFTENGHEYKIYLAALDANGNVLNNGAAWNAIYVDNVLALDTPDITSHEKLSTHCTDEDLYVEWDPVDCATDYTIAAKKLNAEPKFNDNEAGTNITFSRTDNCQIKINKSKLEVGKYYKVALCATNTKQGVSSDWASVYILMEESGYLDVSDCDDLDSASGSTGSFWIYSNLDWSITCNKSWLSWTKNQKDDTHTEIVVKATSANTGTSNRKATFTISAAGKDDVYVYVYQLAPEIEFPSFSNVSVTENVTLGEDITWSATVNGNGSLLETVTVGIYSKQNNDSVYLRNTNIGKETYVLNGFVTTGSVVSGYDASGNAKTLDMSYTGEYTVTFHASTDASTNNYAKTDPVTVTVTEPVGTGILGDVNSDGSVTNMDRYIFHRYLEGDNISIDSAGADINRDGSINYDDYVILSKHLSQMSGYEDLYTFSNATQAKPILSGIQDRYTIKKGDSLKLSFSVSAIGGGLIEKITLKHNQTGTTFAPISYTTNNNTYSDVFGISGYPLDTIGTYDFIIYCRASNYTITDNAIYRFTVDVIDSECTHPTEAIDDIYKSTVYDSAVNSSETHTYHHTFTRKCTNCGVDLSTVSSGCVTEEHSISKKGYCLCGYIDHSDYISWDAHNTSAGRSIVYRTPESTGYYGEIYADESVTVIGECCDRYLIEYSISGGTKIGYVNKDALYRTFAFNGNTIKLYDVIGTTILYANTSELMSQIYGMYDRKSDDTATLIYYRTINTDSAIVINVDLSQADDWDGITFSVKGIKNQIIGYILTTKLNGEHYIDLNQFLEYASIASYNMETASNEAELLNMVLIRDHEMLIQGCQDNFNGGIKDCFDSIFCKGVICSIINSVQGVIDMSSGEIVNGDDIMDTIVLDIISDKQTDVIDTAIECAGALEEIDKVYKDINDKLEAGKLLPTKFSKFLEAIEKMSDTQFNSMLGSQVVGENINNKELSVFLSEYGLSIEVFPIDKIGSIRKAVKCLNTIDTIDKIITPLLDGTNRYLTHKKISDNFKQDVKEELLLLKNTAYNPAIQNTIQSYIANIESGNYDSLFNVSETWEAAGYTVQYLAENPDIIKSAFNYSYNLSTRGFFGAKIASGAAKLGSSSFLKVVNQIYLVDLFTRFPKIFAGVIGFDISKGYDIEMNLAEIAEGLWNTNNQLSVYDLGSREYVDAFNASKRWCDAIAEYVADYFDCFPDLFSSNNRIRWNNFYTDYMNNRAKMQVVIDQLNY